MAQFILTIPDAQLTRVLTSIGRNTGWSAGTGLTRGEWAAEQLEAWVRDHVVRDESEMARAAKQAEVEAAITVTVT
jgi:hypothetical protein